MAQDFEAVYAKNIRSGSYSSGDGTFTSVLTSNSDDAIIGFRFANKNSGSCTIDAKISRSSVDYYLIKNAPVPGGGSLELIDGGSKVVIQNGDIVKVAASRTGSEGVDVAISYIDAIST
jgi:hypothetical protein|tara:strand:+ start:128 stop:484 length:357 start_codon:yes stop_codon:yes gene_type:complete